ncbi:GNAT family N-acetyltransferase [Peloplasma aerotolerans]|uniref:GNAT family N-acetyltransferase n=1 Tax=Peloplasma aerotolerans TaxID=3044389 RepID=A0AAW6UCW6_9MOLU|nr:GNAT family N-acetyltransferase [Mariniplasma sp. M4Ah]MDI6453331.1 GNAT family N-acetyltransferase [Mariniplasma sp. M4Ah]
MFRIKKLTPELIDTYTSFFDGLSFDHEPHWKSCYCHFFQSEGTTEAWIKRTGDDNKLSAIRNIYEGMMTGFLAFEDEKCIGWVNANDVKYYKRLEEELKDFIKDKKIASTICYVIHPDYRNQGVARKLLAHAIDYFKHEGYQGMIAFPSERTMDKERHYHGTMNMYLEHNYEEVDAFHGVKMLYKKLI